MRFLPLMLLPGSALAHPGHGAGEIGHALDHAAMIAVPVALIAAAILVWARR